MLKGILCRSILFPKCMSNGAFDDMALMQLTDVNRDGSVYALSVASRFVLKDEEGAHKYGCRTAKRINDGYTQRTGLPPAPDKRTVYLGFYDAIKKDLIEIKSEHYLVRIRHHIEYGERSHFNLEFVNRGFLGTGKASDRIRRQDRQVAIMQAVSKMAGPLRYAHEEDGELVKEIELPRLPREDAI